MCIDKYSYEKQNFAYKTIRYLAEYLQIFYVSIFLSSFIIIKEVWIWINMIKQDMYLLKQLKV